MSTLFLNFKQVGFGNTELISRLDCDALQEDLIFDSHLRSLFRCGHTWVHTQQGLLAVTGAADEFGIQLCVMDDAGPIARVSVALHECASAASWTHLHQDVGKGAIKPPAEIVAAPVAPWVCIRLRSRAWTYRPRCDLGR